MTPNVSRPAERITDSSTATRQFADLNEFAAAAPGVLGYSRWLEITQQRVDLFADATDDHQWIHVDAERAADGPYGTTVAHGYLTVSLIPRLVSPIYQVNGLRMRINYGSNKVRFPAPVPVGSRVRAMVELLSVDETPRGMLSTTRVTIEIEGASKPGCVAEVVGLMVPA